MTGNEESHYFCFIPALGIQVVDGWWLVPPGVGTEETCWLLVGTLLTHHHEDG